jgi:galactose-1-phosphate uridylyltransferase
LLDTELHKHTTWSRLCELLSEDDAPTGAIANLWFPEDRTTVEEELEEDEHWDGAKYVRRHLEVMRRPTDTAGFERATGFYVNPVMPEDAAKILRDREG